LLKLRILPRAILVLSRLLMPRLVPYPRRRRLLSRLLSSRL
jgi:hypothetical protein